MASTRSRMSSISRLPTPDKMTCRASSVLSCASQFDDLFQSGHPFARGLFDRVESLQLLGIIGDERPQSALHVPCILSSAL